MTFSDFSTGGGALYPETRARVWSYATRHALVRENPGHEPGFSNGVVYYVKNNGDAWCNAYWITHEISHVRTSTPEQLARINFGLGGGPNDACLDYVARESAIKGIDSVEAERVATALDLIVMSALRLPFVSEWASEGFLDRIPDYEMLGYFVKAARLATLNRAELKSIPKAVRRSGIARESWEQAGQEILQAAKRSF